MAQSEINLENGAEKTVWSEEYERVPLKQRLKLLLASHRVSVDSELKSERQIPVLPPNVGVAAAEKRENGHCDIQHLQSGCSAEEQVIETVERHAVKVECAGNCVESPSATYLNGSILAGSQTVISEHEMGDESLDELDHVVLKERLKRLLTSKCLGSASTKAEENSAAVVKGELLFGDQRHVPGNQIHDIDRTSISSSKDTVNLSCKPSEALGQFSGGNRSTCPDSLGIWRNDMGCSSEKEFFKHKSGGKTLLSGAVRTVQGSAISNLAMIKIEPPNYDEFQSSNVTTPGQMSFRNLVPVKTEVQVAGNADEDELDHMLLRERMKLLSSSDGPSLDIHQGSECFSKMIPSALGCRPVASKPSLSLKVNCPRKRRKTVTDSIETAMEEDAPGLLQVGDDLSDGEARVLMEYGWVPNTGLGTMLNYYDRVVHDRKTERSSEWRSKIGKLLMDGYNGGTIISAGIPGKVAEYNVAQPQEIKLELS
ncbi:UNVERIFIED_CONTAM: hypothetical protein Sindi_0041800 [Sesamum indicum]